MAFTTQVLKCSPESVTFDADKPVISSVETREALKRASEQLRAQQTVAFPTETVYGLGALALEPEAAARIFSTKGRPPDNPLIVHVSSKDMLTRILPKEYTISGTKPADRRGPNAFTSDSEGAHRHCGRTYSGAERKLVGQTEPYQSGACL
ncbi:hypothetical protein NUW54_g13903 [Trametes sanguinea]|uniref:Uncharacterized protein n=1 Tax=Trametes sanguinea TaxID=158606 RepID=A0ACC1MGH6_9APHY|nr:hypothetical protein NUW54_g13903 [Trametes sanguinea]